MEFITAACDHKKVASKENIKKAFSLFDANNNGTIDVNEFKFALPMGEGKSLNYAVEPGMEGAGKNLTQLVVTNSLNTFN